MRYIIVLVATFLTTQAFAQILIDESGSSSRWLGNSVRSELSQFSSVESLRGLKRMGLSATVAGATGLIGTNMHLNFTRDFTFSLGIGMSHGFQSFNMHIKQSLGGETVMPYFVAGYSRWYTNGPEGTVDRTSPPMMGKKFLSARERQTGEFAENIIYPGLGLEYVTLSGDWQGMGFFAEALFLLDIDDFVAGGTAGVGTIYYF
jgi:hypothetical protein